MTPSELAGPDATIVDPRRDIVTAINVFTVKPDHQQAFIDAQIGEYKRLSGKIAGALGANLHTAVSGRKAVNYAHFRTVEELRGWQGSPLMKQHLPVIRPHLEAVQPGIYSAAAVVSRDAPTARLEPGGSALIAVLFVDGDEDELATGQRQAAARLVEELPAVRSVILHRRIDAAGGERGQRRDHASGAPRLPDAAVYVQLEDVEAGRSLLAHPRFRAWFTAESPLVREADVDIYELTYVQNEAALAAPPPE